jgi:hypothetical protein
MAVSLDHQTILCQACASDSLKQQHAQQMLQRSHHKGIYTTDVKLKSHLILSTTNY